MTPRPTATRPTAMFSTPYGVEVPVYDHPAVKGEYLFSTEASAVCAGIFDDAEQRRFVDDARAVGHIDFDRAGEYGGFSKLLKLPLSRPAQPLYPQLLALGVHKLGLGNPLDAFVTLVMDYHRWCDRAGALLQALEQNLRPMGDEMIEMAMAIAMQGIVTGALEHLAEAEIDCLEAAAFYALTKHDQWRQAGVSWLEPVRKTWFRQWVDARPVYKTFAARCRVETDLPGWIEGTS